jgi:hypothetical protein
LRFFSLIMFREAEGRCPAPLEERMCFYPESDPGRKPTG